MKYYIGDYFTLNGKSYYRHFINYKNILGICESDSQIRDLQIFSPTRLIEYKYED